MRPGGTGVAGRRQLGGEELLRHLVYRTTNIDTGTTSGVDRLTSGGIERDFIDHGVQTRSKVGLKPTAALHNTAVGGVLCVFRVCAVAGTART